LGSSPEPPKDYRRSFRHLQRSRPSVWLGGRGDRYPGAVRACSYRGARSLKKAAPAWSCPGLALRRRAPGVVKRSLSRSSSQPPRGGRARVGTGKTGCRGAGGIRPKGSWAGTGEKKGALQGPQAGGKDRRGAFRGAGFGKRGTRPGPQGGGSGGARLTPIGSRHRPGPPPQRRAIHFHWLCGSVVPVGPTDGSSRGSVHTVGCNTKKVCNRLGGPGRAGGTGGILPPGAQAPGRGRDFPEPRRIPACEVHSGPGILEL